MKFYIKSLYFYIFISVVLSQNNIEELKNENKKHCSEPTHKHYPLINLGYITPWKKEGYKMLDKFYNKFDIISPVWFELVTERINGRFNVKIDGSNDVDMDLLDKLKKNNEKIKILPRFHCQYFSQRDMENWLDNKNIPQFIKILMRRIRYHGFDGMVLDCVSLFYSESYYDAFTKLLLPKISEEFKKDNLQLVVTLFPKSDVTSNVVSQKKFKAMSQYIDYFNIMTYDYYSHQKANSNPDHYYSAPLSWIKQTIDMYVDKEKDKPLLKKILLGLPFHGYFYLQGDRKGIYDLDSSKFNNYLENGKEKNFWWDENECEHMIEIQSGNQVFNAAYPTRKFLKERLDYSINNNLGGCAIWDIGNGNENFLDEF